MSGNFRQHIYYVVKCNLTTKEFEACCLFKTFEQRVESNSNYKNTTVTNSFKHRCGP